MSRKTRETELNHYPPPTPEQIRAKAQAKEDRRPRLIPANLILNDVARCTGNDSAACTDCLRRLQVERDPKCSLTLRPWIAAAADASGCEHRLVKS